MALARIGEENQWLQLKEKIKWYKFNEVLKKTDET
jgi:hypothetical protein